MAKYAVVYWSGPGDLQRHTPDDEGLESCKALGTARCVS
jgi:hypothetical protein